MGETLDILILGCGYTGQRVAKCFLAMGARVTATTRHPQRLAGLGAEIISTADLPKHVRPGMLVLHSIPPAARQGFSIRCGIRRGGSCIFPQPQSTVRPLWRTKARPWTTTRNGRAHAWKQSGLSRKDLGRR